MNLNLKDKVVLVTGSSRGIGYSIAKTFHAEGCKVILNGKNKINLNKASHSLPGSIAFAGDVTKHDDVQSLVTNIYNNFGGLDIVVCNVGNGSSVQPGDETLAEWQRVFALNMWSTTNIIEATKNLLISSKGAIVCISSICGIDIIPGAPLTYSAAKAALNSYVRGMAHPLGKQGVRINAIASGNINTEDSFWGKKLKFNPSEVDLMLKNNVSLGRLGQPEEIANLVAYLASPLASYATGGIWTLDGGQICK